MRTLAITNQKGGVGKTTVAVHIAEAAAEAKLRTLMFDFDRQRSLSLTFPGAERGRWLRASDLFARKPVDAKPEPLTKYLSIIRADPDGLDKVSNRPKGIMRRPAERLAALADDYDLCVIDTPGALGFNPPMTVGALIAADAVVCPFNVGLYESQALSDLWAYINSIRTLGYNPGLKVLGLLPSKVNSKSKVEREALAAIRQQFGAAVLAGELSERSAVKQAINMGRPVWRNTRGAGHLAAAKEWRDVCNLILGMLGDDSR